MRRIRREAGGTAAEKEYTRNIFSQSYLRVYIAIATERQSLNKKDRSQRLLLYFNYLEKFDRKSNSEKRYY